MNYVERNIRIKRPVQLLTAKIEFLHKKKDWEIKKKSKSEKEMFSGWTQRWHQLRLETTENTRTVRENGIYNTQDTWWYKSNKQKNKTTEKKYK